MASNSNNFHPAAQRRPSLNGTHNHHAHQFLAGAADEEDRIFEYRRKLTVMQVRRYMSEDRYEAVVPTAGAGSAGEDEEDRRAAVSKWRMKERVWMPE